MGKRYFLISLVCCAFVSSTKAMEQTTSNERLVSQKVVRYGPQFYEKNARDRAIACVKEHPDEIIREYLLDKEGTSILLTPVFYRYVKSVANPSLPQEKVSLEVSEVIYPMLGEGGLGRWKNVNCPPQVILEKKIISSE